MRWIVDAMNVIGTRPDGWWRDRHGAMVKLVHSLERWVAETGEQVTVVFEKEPKPPISSETVEIAFAPRAGANSADQEIVRLVREADGGDEVRVVTSDRALAEQVRSLSAAVEPAQAFRGKLDES